MSQLQAGGARVPLPAVIGEPMGGYLVRREPSIGIHDQPYAKALCLDDGDTALVIVTLDLARITAEEVARVRRRVREATGIPEQHILVSYSHTHSGPWVPFSALSESQRRLRKIWGEREDVPGWAELLVRLIATAAIQAWRNRQPARLGFGRGQVDGITFNRRRKEKGALDTEVMVLLLADQQDRPLVVLVNYACHPVVLRHDNLLITAEYPWAMMELVESVYPGAVAMFAQGAGANIDPLQELWWSFEGAERMGRVLGAEAVKVVNQILLKGCQPEVLLAAVSTQVSLPQAKQPGVDEAEALVASVRGELAEAQAALDAHIAAPTPGRFAGLEHAEERLEAFLRHAVERAQAGVLWAEMLKDMALKGVVIPEQPCEVQAMRLGDARLVSMAGEIFNELGQEVKDALGRGKTFFLGYANGACGYVPTPDSFAEGGHEIVFAQRMYWGLSMLPEAGPLLVREAIALAQTL